MPSLIETNVNKEIAKIMRIEIPKKDKKHTNLIGLIDHAIRSGIDFSAVEKTRAAIKINDSPFSDLLGVSLSTLKRYRTHNTKLSVSASDRFYRLIRIFALASTVLGSADNATEWLREPQFAFDGQTPLELMKTEVGTKQVENFLIRAEYGDLL
jgi:putative toxin-antitoxin system antitoxin component (TIGR02293 family)